MSVSVNGQFIRALKIDCDKRSLNDLQIIYYGLHNLESLSTYRDSFLRSLCKIVRYEKHPANEILFFTGEFAKCWYILLSGAVFIGGSMFLPGSSFGKRNGGSCRRSSECFVLESSEMIVIEYPEGLSASNSTTNSGNSLNYFNITQPSVNQNKNITVGQNFHRNIVQNKSKVGDFSTGNKYQNQNKQTQSQYTVEYIQTSPTGYYQQQQSQYNQESPSTHQSNFYYLKSLSQSPLLSPASAGSVSISSGGATGGGGGGGGGVSLSPVSSCCQTNLSLSGGSTPTNVSDPNLAGAGTGDIFTVSATAASSSSSLYGGSFLNSSSKQEHKKSVRNHHLLQTNSQQQSSGGGGGAVNPLNNTQYHTRQTNNCCTTPSILCQQAIGCQNSLLNHSNITQINSNICYKTFNMDPHHIRHSGLPGNRPELYQKCNRGSHSSDTSSAYSGSDTMTSVHSSSLDTDEVDLSGLVESVVDSDEEDLAESMDSLNVRDAVRDCLEKDPSERTEDDIEALLELTQGLKAFTNMTLAVRRALCSVMVFAVVDKAGTMVMSDGEELDSWSVLINGHVEIEHKNGEKEELHVGDSFGILPTMDKLYHRGVMRTKCDDCQFVCITQTDYYRIQHQGEENTKRHEDENGQIVMVTELRQIGPDTASVGTTAIAAGTNSSVSIMGNTSSLRRGHVVIRGTISRLMLQLIEENSMTDPTYVEDFLLTHRTFIDNPKEVAKQLLQWFENEDCSPLHTNATGQEVRDRVSRVLLLWVNNHFTDFEMDPEMMEYLEKFETGLEQKLMPDQLRLLHIACAAKARTRNVTLTRSSRDEDLNFKIIGPSERSSYGVFISHVEKKTKAEDVGLKRGDQILEVNGQSFEHVTYTRAMEILMNSTHLSVTVKSNLLAFKEMLQQPVDTKSPRNRSSRNNQRICASDLVKLHSNDPRQTAAAVARLSTHEFFNNSISSGSVSDQVDFCQSPFRDTQQTTNSNSISNNFVTNFLHNSTRSGTGKDSSGTGNTAGSSSNSSSGNNKGGFMTLGPKRRIQKALIKMNLLPKNHHHHHHHHQSTLNAGNSQSNVDDDLITTSVTGTTASISSTSTTTQSSSSSSSSALHLQNNAINDQTNKLITGINSTGSLPGCCNSNNNSNKIGNSYANSNYCDSSACNCSNTSTKQKQLYHSHSNPDLTTLTTSSISQTTNVANLVGIAAAQQQQQQQQQQHPIYYEDIRQSDYPEHVLKVYKSDQTCKYLLINKETTAHEVVMLALQEFGIHETSSNFSLCEVSVSEGGMIKQRRLPEHMQNLAERIGLSARYYLKTNGITETLVPDELAPDLIRESVVHLLQLNANEVAIQLTFQDFAIFRQIESTEYVDDLFELKSRYGTPMLKQFSELVNREMFWVVTEICSEHNMVRRMKIVKQFIKIARHCKECRNFNSMFAIISGLGHAAVTRLRQTWEKLPTKYQKLFNDLQDLMDPSRNMSKYRQLVSAELLAQHPIIPFYPVVKKDLTFIHLGNDTRIENLINFEKLRMIAKEVRLLTHMCSSTYDLLTMLEFKGQPPSSAMVALNQMSVSTGSSSVVGGVGNISNNVIGTCIGGNTTSTTHSTLANHQNSSNSNNTISGTMSSVIGGTMSGVSSLLYAAGGGNATVKRRKKSAAAPNPKKMFEEAQMVRRVKAYLNNMKIVTDEDVLHNLSLECEPSTGGGHGGGSTSGSIGGGNSAPNTTITVRKRHPSPTLSTTSSTSSTSEGKKGNIIVGGANVGPPKFGTASPQAVKKILSLSESTKTRPHQPRPHPGIQLPLVNVGNLHHHPFGTSISPSPSPGSHRRMGSCSSASTGSTNITNGCGSSTSGSAGGIVSPNSNVLVSGVVGIVGAARVGIHERSHSDTPTPLPSVDLSAESSSVTSLSNLPLRKNITLCGSVTSNDSGHGSCVQAEIHSNCSDSSSGLYHVASSIVHNSPSPTLQQRRHSSTHAHNIMAPPPPKGIRYPPAYSVAAQMARLHRIGRAHSHEGVTSAIPGVQATAGLGVAPGVNVNGTGQQQHQQQSQKQSHLIVTSNSPSQSQQGYYSSPSTQQNHQGTTVVDEDDDDAQVSAV